MVMRADVAIAADELLKSYRASKTRISQEDFIRSCWVEALPPRAKPPFPPYWCGAFSLSALHIAGVACEKYWHVGKGISSILRPTRIPKVGDIAYFSKLQHHAVVVEVTSFSVTVVQGNSPGVTKTTVPRSSVAAWYSISPWVSDP